MRPRAVSFLFSLTVLLSLFLCPSAAVAQASGQVIPGRYLITFSPGVAAPAQAAQQLSRAHGFRVLHVYQYALQGMAIEVPEAAAAHVLNALRRDPRVATIGHDRTVVAFAQAVPKGINRINAEPGMSPNTGTGVRVAIVDTGLDFNHADLAANIDTSLSVNCINGGGNCAPGGLDDNGHGTLVGGVVAAVNNNLNLVGVGPQIALLAVKVLNSSGSGSFTDIIAAMDYLTGLNLAGTRVGVANMSLGATCDVCTDNSTDPGVAAFHDAVRALVNSGTALVVASGNDGLNAATTVPASFDEVITTSALADSDGQPGGQGPPICVLEFLGFCFEYAEDDSYASFANFGADVDVIAPGVEETLLALGGGTTTASGTSFASPHAAGVAALFIRDQLDKNKGFPTPAVVRQALIETGECPEGSGSVLHGTAGCQQKWLGDPDNFTEPLVRADKVATFTPVIAHDVAVTSISVAPPVAVNTTKNVSVAVANQGTEEETFTVSLSDTLLATIGNPQTVTLAAGASQALTFAWTPTETGDHGLTATASSVAGETDTGDNQKSVSVSVVLPTHDVAITAVTAPSPIIQGNTVAISVSVANQGTYDEFGVAVSVVDSPPAGGAAGTVSPAQTIDLLAGASITLSFNWNTSGAGLGDHTLSATAALAGDDEPGDNSASATSTVDPPLPAAPSGLVATAISGTQINITWQDNSDNERGFRLERCTGIASTCDSNPTWWSQSAELGPNTTAYSDTTVKGSTTYSYRVRAFNVSGNSAYSNTDDATTPSLLKPPAAPTNLTSTALSATQIRLTWQDNSNNESSFRIERCAGTAAYCDANPAKFKYVSSVAMNYTTFTDGKLSPQTTYSHRVRAYNADGYSAYSNTAQATTPPITQLPAAPTNLAATATSSSQIRLTWTDNSLEEQGFRVERCQGSGCTNFVQVAQLVADTRVYNNNGLQPETLYRYRVLAYNQIGVSAYSNIAEATTRPPLPAAPSNLTATAVSSSQINLSWTDNSTNETGFKIERCAGATCTNFGQIATVGANVTGYSNTGLAAGTTYRYRVRAYNISGNSSYSNIASATTQSAP